MSENLIHTNLLDTLTESVYPQTDLQKEALSVLRQLGLPGNKNEEYKYTPLTRALEKGLQLGHSFVTSGDLPTDEHWKIPGLDAYEVILVNGKFIAEKSSLPVTAKATPMHQASDRLHADKLIGRYADFKTDAFAAWNTATWNDGLYLEIPDGIKLDKPLIIYYLHDSANGQVKSVSRNMVVAGASSEATLIEKWCSFGNNTALSNTLSEIVLHEHAQLNHLVIQNDVPTHIQYLFNQFWQRTGSKLNSHVVTLDGAFIRNNTRVSLDGENCDSHLYGLYLLHNHTLADNHTVVDHRKPNSYSNELYKGILEDQSKGVFNGKIFVRPDAQKTNAFQSNRNILLSDKATINTKPQLEIWADDVKCSHGCTTGQLDEEAIFYLRSRGINQETARAMVLYAFASEVLETITDTSLRTYIDNLVSERLHKNF
ncbi:MAG: Fe-S cluster assembly protein SufD [Flammeovirgaceae bacterium]|nr:MAG: Fe-S cluster assembly protein SufD [Flammeovirgaceae bacterium]